MTDREGQTVWRARMWLWGRVRHEERSDIYSMYPEQNLRFAGQYLDRETGLHYNTLRYFLPESGRFSQPDPVGLAGGLNLYQYAPNPLSWIDPLGLSCGKVGKVGYRIIQRTKDYVARLLKNRSDFRYVSNYMISKYKASLRVTKTDAYGNKYRFFDGKDIHGNRIEIEVAHTGHRSVNGGMEPPHIKVKTKDINNKTTNIDKYFLEDDIYRIMGQ